MEDQVCILSSLLCPAALSELIGQFWIHRSGLWTAALHTARDECRAIIAPLFGVLEVRRVIRRYYEHKSVSRLSGMLNESHISVRGIVLFEDDFPRHGGFFDLERSRQIELLRNLSSRILNDADLDKSKWNSRVTDSLGLSDFRRGFDNAALLVAKNRFIDTNRPTCEPRSCDIFPYIRI